MFSTVKFDSAVDEQRVRDLELRHHLTHEALRLARAQLDGLQTTTPIEELQMRRLLGKVQWLQGKRADLQEALDRLTDGVHA
jgi:hypothetical protein